MKQIIIALLIAITATVVRAELVTEEVTYTDGTTSMKGYIAWDNATTETRPGVLVVHEWWGHNDYARKRAEKLAGMGYTALAVDMYGDGKTADHPSKAGEFSSAVFENIDEATARFKAAQAFLEAHPSTEPGQTAAIGYCFGGGVVLHMARFGLDLKGVASFHGSLGTESPAEPGVVKAAVLVCNGADDSFVPEDDISALDKEMKAAGVDYTFKSYAGAIHSFTNPGATAVGEKFEIPLAYNEAADHASWHDLATFLERIFAPVMVP